MLPYTYVLLGLLLMATVGKMQATCPGNRSPPPISWRCPPQMSKSFFRSYQFIGQNATTVTRAGLPLPNIGEFNSECLTSFIADISSTGPFAAAGDQCFPSPSCQAATTRYGIVALDVQFGKGVLFNGSNDFSECPLLNVSGATVSYPNGRRLRSQAKITCPEGYVLNSMAQIFCEHDGKWYDFSGSFIRQGLYKNKACIRCNNDPPSIPDGRLLVCPDQATAKIQCNSGYSFNGTSNLLHFQVTAWSTPIGTCQRDTGTNCSPTQSVMNGNLLITSTRVDSEAKVVCLKNYGISANYSTVKCKVGGSWSLTDQNNCVRATCLVDPVQYASLSPVNGSVVGIGDITTIQCPVGFIRQGNAALVCVWSEESRSAEWHSSKPSCIRTTCQVRPIVANSKIHTINDTNGSERAIVECNVGFNLTGRAAITCADGNSWSKLPTCDALNCGQPPITINGTLLPGNSTVFSVREYSCNEGFTLQGNSNVTCFPSGADAVWSGRAPMCVKTQCEERPSVPNGVVNYIQNDAGIEIKAVVECDVGFNLTGAKEWSCLTELPSTQSPACEASRCGNVTIPVNGDVSDGNDTVFSVREYTCDSGFKLEGHSRVSCLPNRDGAEWSGNAPQCTHIRCEVPEDTGKTYSISGMSVNATLLLVCGEGLTTGGKTARCNDNGSWTGLEALVCNNISARTVPTVTSSAPEKQILTNTTSIVILAVIGALAAMIVLLLIVLARLRRSTSSSMYRPDEDGIPMHEPTKKEQSERSIISNTTLEDRPSGQEDPDIYDVLQRPDGPQAHEATAPVAESDAGDFYDHLKPEPTENTVDAKPTTSAAESTGQEPSADDDLYSIVDTKNADSGESTIESQAVQADQMYGTVDMSAKRQRSTKPLSDNGDQAAGDDEDQPPPPRRGILDTPEDDPEVPSMSSDEAKLV